MASLYHPLAQRSVRLLTFLDETGINCMLEEIPLDNAPPYACLSYAWQDERVHRVSETKQSVTLNGLEKSITSNLYDALLQVGPVVRSHGYKFWVDAICINQDDLEERAEQVTLMKRIFEEAKRVIGWVGLATTETDLAVGLLHTLENFTHGDFGRVSARTAVQLWQATLSRQPFFHQRPKADVLKAWAEMVQMFKRAYWSRAWVHQEVTGPNVMFYCGPWSFTWKELHAFNVFHNTYSGLPDMPDQYMLMLSGGINMGSPFFDLLSAEENRAAMRHSNATTQSLLVLMRELRLTFCSDGRDKVFAALSHATDAAVSDACGMLAVDYSKSVADVFRDVAKTHLLRGNLEVLGYIGAECQDVEYRPTRGPNEPPLPSWAPDWRVPNRIRPLNAGSRLTRDYTMLYSPCPNTTARLVISRSSVLEIQGVVFETLRAVLPTSGREYVPAQLKTKWAKHMKAWSPSLTDRDVKRILNADVQWSTDGDHNIRGGQTADWDILDKPGNSLPPEQRDWRYNMRHIIRSVCRDRRAGRTDGGRIGIFPEAARPGDRIAAFYGGHALYVVRAVQDKEGVHSFVGECYVDGMMDGQVMDLMERKGLEAEMVILV